MNISARESKGRIMLVEDNQNLRKVLKDYLETLKFNVSDFSNGDAASESFERHRYDICIFDIVMQGKSGFDLLAEIRKVDEQVPVVFLTARLQMLMFYQHIFQNVYTSDRNECMVFHFL